MLMLRDDRGGAGTTEKACNPRTPVVGSVVSASADRYEPLFVAVNSACNPAFH